MQMTNLVRSVRHELPSARHCKRPSLVRPFTAGGACGVQRMSILTAFPRPEDSPEAARECYRKADTAEGEKLKALACTLRMAGDHIQLLLAANDELREQLISIRSELEARKEASCSTH